MGGSIGSHNLTIAVKVGTRSLTALVDTGSSVSFIRESAIPIPHEKRHTGEFSFITVNQNKFSVSSRCELPILYNNNLMKHDFYVFEDCAFPILLGTDFLRKYSCEIRFLGNDGESVNLSNTFPVLQVARSTDGDCLASQIIQRVSIGDDIPVEEKKKIIEVIQEYQDIFAKNDEDLGRTSLVKHEICTGDQPPHKLRPFRQPQFTKAYTKQAIEKMLATGVIRHSNSPWSSPFFLIKKRDGQYRFVVDFRKLNEKTVSDCFPLPLITDLLDGLAGAEIFTTLDLASGFWQVELEESSKHKTAFQFENNLYEFNVLAFGLKNAPATFQRLLQKIFSDCGILPYIDDIVIAAKDYDDHLRSLKEVFDRLRKSGLKLKPQKCNIGHFSTTYLGHYICKDGIRPDPAKVTKLQEMIPPKNKKELDSFCGFVGYLSKFVKNFSDIMQPLYEMRKQRKFNWSDECQRAFRTIIDLLTEDVLLRYPKFDQTFFVDVDASNYSIGGVLYQNDGPIAFYSRKLNKSEVNYSTTDREFLALVETIDHFRHYLLGRPFVVYSDHQALSYMVKGTPTNSRHARYLMRLEEYDFELQFKNGSNNQSADVLSRMVNNTFIVNDTDNYFRQEQMKDPNLIDCFHKIESGIHAPAGYSIDQIGQLLYYGKIVIPNHLEKHIMDLYHNSGHFCVSKVRQSILGAGYWFKLMRKKLFDAYKNCPVCVKKSGSGYIPTKISLPQSPMIEPFEFIAVDIVGPLPLQRSNYQYVLTMVDHATRWLEAVPLTNIRSETCAKAIRDNWIYRYGPPSTLHSDRGTQFLSSVLSQLLDNFSILKSTTTAYNPQANSILERVHRTLKDRLITYGDSWLDSLQRAVYDINRTESTPLGSSPMLLNFGRTGIVPSDWPTPTRFRRSVWYRGPQCGDFVAVKVASPPSLKPHFQGKYKVISRPSPNVAKLSNGEIVNIRRLRTI